MPLHSSVHIDRPLSNFAVAYPPGPLIASQVVPFVDVTNKSDSYFKFNKKDQFTVPQTIRGPKAYSNEVDWATTSASYAAVDHALREFLPDSIIANSDPVVDPRRRTTEMVTGLLMLDYELTISALVTTYANYGSSYRVQLSGGDRWDVFSTSDPLANVSTARMACFLEPNVCLMGVEVWDKLKQHPQILDRVSGGATNASPAMVTPRLVAELFEVDRLLIGRKKYNNANYAATESYAYVWGKDVVLAYVSPTPSLDDPSAWKTFRWRQMTTAVGYQVKTYRDEGRGGGGEWIDVETSYDDEAICTDNAYLIDTVIS